MTDQMTDKQWSEALAEIDTLHFQLAENIMSSAKRRELRAQLVVRLRNLAEKCEELSHAEA